MSMMFLKKVKQPGQEKSIKFLLHQHLSGPRPTRPMKNVHASELTKPGGICPRAYALNDVTSTNLGNDWLSTSERLTFALGDAMAEVTVQAMADLDKAVCHWRCRSCSCLHQFQKRPTKCGQCSSKRFKYEEVRFESAICGASCGVDMLVSLGDSKLLPVELKTMAADSFKTLAAPLAEHRLRTNLYLRLIAESDSPWAQQVRTDRACVLYISKAGYGCASPDLKAWGLKEGFSPFKEFWVDRDDSQTDVLVNPAIAVKAFRGGSGLIPEGVCAHALEKRACACPFKVPCFSGIYPAGEALSA